MLFPVSCWEKERTFKINNRALARFAEELAGSVLCCSLEISGNATKTPLLPGNCLYWSGNGCRVSCASSLLPSPNTSNCIWQEGIIMFLQDSEIPGSSAHCWYKRFLPSLDVLPASRREQGLLSQTACKSLLSQTSFFRICCKCQPLTRTAPARPVFGHFFSFLDTEADTKSEAELWRVVHLCKLHRTPSWSQWESDFSAELLALTRPGLTCAS